MVEQAVILAGPPASDRRLLGLTLLQRAVLALAHGGIRNILVLGPVPDWENDRRLKVCGARLRWAAAGEARLPLAGDPFLLLAGPVVFSAALAQRLHQLEFAGDRLLVPAGGDGPGAPGFSGLALCRAALFPRLLAAAGSDGRDRDLGALLAAAPLLPLAGNDWARADSREGERRARRLLRRSLGKPSDGFFSRSLNRHISWPISRLLIRLRVRPNQVTAVNLALGLLCGWLIGRGGYAHTLAAGLLFQFVSVFDGCDGEIARLTFRFSAWGAKLDNLCDLVTLVVFIVDLPIGLYAATADAFYLLLGASTVLVVAIFYLLLLARMRLSGHRGNIAAIARQVQDRGKDGRPLRWLERLGVRLGFIFRKEFISLYAMAWCIAGRAGGLLWTIVCLTPLGIVYELDHVGQLRARRQAEEANG
jgi:phosphatidylglycerophosphate synthase